MPDTATPPSGISLRRLMPLGVLVAAGMGFVVAGGHRYLTFSALAENRLGSARLAARWGLVSRFIAYIAAYAALVALSVPGGAILTIAGGFLFGPVARRPVRGRRRDVGCGGNLSRRARRARRPCAQRAGPLCWQSSKPGFAPTRSIICCSCVWCRCFRSGWSTSCRRWPACGLPVLVLATFIGIIPGTFVYASLGSGLGKLVAAARPRRSSSARACWGRLSASPCSRCPGLVPAAAAQERA